MLRCTQRMRVTTALVDIESAALEFAIANYIHFHSPFSKQRLKCANNMLYSLLPKASRPDNSSLAFAHWVPSPDLALVVLCGQGYTATPRQDPQRKAVNRLRSSKDSHRLHTRLGLWNKTREGRDRMCN